MCIRDRCEYTVFNLSAFDTVEPEMLKNKLNGIYKLYGEKYAGQRMVFIYKRKAVKVSWQDVVDGKATDLLKMCIRDRVWVRYSDVGLLLRVSVVSGRYRDFTDSMW